jgi:hypothetical protein
MSAEVVDTNMEANLNDGSQMEAMEMESQHASKTLLSASRQRQLNSEQEGAATGFNDPKG